MNESSSPTWPVLRAPVATLASAVFLVVLALYANTLGNRFVFDDGTLIVQNPNIVGMRSWPRQFTTGYWAEELSDKLYRPVTMLSYAVQRRFNLIGGLNPSPYHFVNIVLHGANAALLCLLAARLFGDGRKLLALAAGLVFAVHPIQADAVAPVYGRADLLAGLGCLLALWFWTRARPAWVPATVSFAFGLFAKESAVVLPALAAVCDAAQGRLRRDNVREWAVRYGVLAGVIVVYLLLRWNALGVLTTAQFYYSQPSLHHPLPLPMTVSVAERLATAFGVIPRYLVLLVWPARLSPDYSFAAVVPGSFTDLGVVAGCVIVVALLGVTVWSWARHRAVALGLAFAAIGYVTMSNLLVPTGAWMAERFLYLPMIGMAMVAGLGAEWLGKRRPPVALVAAVALALWFGRTIVRNRDWRDGEQLWQSAVAAQPRSVLVLHNWGEMQLARGQSEPAIETFRAVLEIAPEMPDTYSTMSRAYLQLRKFDEAAAAAQRAVELRSKFPAAYNNLALALAAKGDYYAAIEHLITATTQNPDFYDAWNNLGVVYFNTGKYTEAIAAYKRSIEIFPGYASSRFNYGLVLLKLNQTADAIQQFAAALQCNPGLTVARLYLAQTYAQSSDWTSAERELKTGVQIEPKNPAFHAALVQLYSATGRTNEAALAAAEVSKLDPTFMQGR